jgi:hypothetical protein
MPEAQLAPQSCELWSAIDSAKSKSGLRKGNLSKTLDCSQDY